MKVWIKITLLTLCILATGCQRQVEQKRVSLFNGNSLEHWKVSNFGTEGEIKVVNRAIELGYGYPITGIHWDGQELPKDRYSLEFEAMKVEGNDFFVGLTFPVREEYCSLILGGWGGTTCGLSSFDYRDASDNETTVYRDFKLKHWVHVKMVVDGEHLQTFVDGEKFIDTQIKGRKVHIRPEVEPSKPLGLCSFETIARYKNIYITQF